MCGKRPIKIAFAVLINAPLLQPATSYACTHPLHPHELSQAPFAGSPHCTFALFCPKNIDMYVLLFGAFDAVVVGVS